MIDDNDELDELDLYWLENYVVDNRCGLCGQTGKVILKDGSTAFCVCPNGRCLKQHGGEWVLGKRQ